MGKAVIATASVMFIISAFIVLVVWMISPNRAQKTHIRKYHDKMKILAPRSQFRLMTYNIGYASGLKNNQGGVIPPEEVIANLDKIALGMKENGADIIAVQEIDFNSHRTSRVNQFDYLAKKLEMPYAAYIVNWNKKYVPYPIGLNFKKHFGRMESGQAVFSRFPITKNSAHFFLKPLNKPFWYNLFYIGRGAQAVKLELSPSNAITILNVHLEAYHIATRESQVHQLLALAKETLPEFIMGDFNAVPPNAKRKNGFPDEPDNDMRGDHTIKTLYEKSGFREMIPEKEYDKNEKEYFSFPANETNRRLDYIFYSNHMVCEKGFIDKNAGMGSDHLPAVGVFMMER
jgi:endonuclease/exonuclease/phosphatase family metal-dependent hydrolase